MKLSAAVYGVLVVQTVLGSAALAQTATPQPKQPVFIYLFTRLDDPYHFDLTSERFERELQALARHRKDYPQYSPSALFQFNGATAQVFSEYQEDSGPLKPLREAMQKGLVEVGYDGSGEPVYVNRPRANLRGVRTARDQWLARGEAANWFLTEFKNFLTGDPDPSRSGGLKRTQEVFGPVVSIGGLSPRELGTDSEVVHQIRRMNTTAVLGGLPESSAWVARQLHGYSGSVGGVSAEMSLPPDTAMELFWQDGYLRASESSGPDVRVVAAHEGSASLKAMLQKLDRSRAHVLRIELAQPAMYLKPNFNNGILDPVRFAQDSPKKYFFDPDQLRPRAEVEAAYQGESDLLKFLEEEFFPSNPGSRFVSTSDLRGMAIATESAQVSGATLTKAAASLLARWGDSGTHPPSFASADGRDFSLAEMFQMLSTALAERHKSGRLPETVRLGTVYGPALYNLAAAPPLGKVTAALLGSICSELAPKLNDEKWNPFPSNMLPDQVRVGEADLNPSQFLHIMAEAVVAPAATEFAIQYFESNNLAGLVYPKTRSLSDLGAVWTLKPARLAWKPRSAAVR